MDVTGLKIRPGSVTRHVETGRTLPDGKPETTAVTYKKGDPEFDAWWSESQKRGKEQFHNMWFDSSGMPKNLAVHASTALLNPHLTRPVAESYERLYRGTGDERGVETAVTELVTNLRGFYMEQGYEPEQFMPKLIEDVYNIARMETVRGAGIASWQESRPLDTANSGFRRDSKNSIYYNADLYYRSEEMKGALPDLMKNIAVKYGVDPAQLDLPEDYPEGDLRKGIYSSYNTIVADGAFNDKRIGWMLDETMKPPRGLRFFYQGNTNGMNTLVPTLFAPREDGGESKFDGVLQIWYGDWSFTGRVPVRKNSYLYPASVNMFDAVMMNHAGDVPDEIIPSLKNWDFFDPGTSSLYQAAHTRKLS